MRGAMYPKKPCLLFLNPNGHATTRFFQKGGGAFSEKGGPNFFRASMNVQNDFAMPI
jgi:hypothetical protein